MELHFHVYRLPTTILQGDIHTHTCMHRDVTCPRHPLNVLMSIFGDDDVVVVVVMSLTTESHSSLMLRVDS